MKGKARNKKSSSLDFQSQAVQAMSRGDWKSAAQFYARACEQRSTELNLINSVQEGLTARLDMQDIFDLVGDKLRDFFDAQVVMISQYDPLTRRVWHHYAIERGQHLQVPGWHPIDSSRGRIVQTRKPYLINLDEITRVVSDGRMQVVPGTELPKTWLGVPMLVGNEVRGIVSLQNLDKENAFSSLDIQLLTALTNSLSLSLENARLFKETQRLLSQAEEEIEIARQTQKSILPAQLPRHQGYDFGALIVPARGVGGDFYDFIPIDRHHLGIVIGDVTDKGLPAALFMALTFSLIRAESAKTKDPCQVLRSVNGYLLKMNASGMFVTLLYSLLDLTSGMLTIARAGHMPPVILNEHGQPLNVPVREGQALGVLDEVAIDLQQHTIPAGGLALLFSDGLNEAADASGAEFGLDRIKDALFAHRAENAKNICEQLWTAVQVYSGESLYQDDFTTVVIKRN